MRKRLVIIVGIWLFTVGWWSKFYKTWAGSPLPSTFGVHIDWGRYHLAKTGEVVADPAAYTSLVNLAGRQGYDLSSWFLAIINIVTGTEGLIEGLTLLNIISLPGLVLFPLVVLAWYRAYPANEHSGHWLLILALVMFPGPSLINKTTEGWMVETFPMALLLLSILIIARHNNDQRGYAMLVLFAGLVFTMHHTWSLIYLLIISTIVILYRAPVKILSKEQVRPAKITLFTVSILIVVFFLVGTHWRPRFRELVVNLSRIFFGGGSQLAKTYFGSGNLARQSLFNLNIRRVLKILNHTAGVSIIGLYLIDRLYLSNVRNPLRFRQDRILLSALAAFPLIIGVFASMGPLNFIIYRTRYIGVFFVILSAAILLQSNKQATRRITSGLVVLMIVTSLAVAPLTGVLTPTHSDRQAESVEWAGENIPDEKYIFAGNRIGTPLIYYDQKGLSIIRSIHPNWTERIDQVYFDDDPRATKQAIIATIQSSRIASSPPVDGHYVIYSNEANDEGVQLLSFATKPVTHPLPEKFDSYPGYNKIYSDNATVVYRSSESS